VSNVLIGIIGVILFIGLALAGALLLGDDFKAANNDTKAAAVVQAMSQTANAVSMYTIKTGMAKQSEAVTSSSGLIPRFLKAAPMNPVTKTQGITLGDQWGNVSTSTALSVHMLLGTTAEAKNVCEAIQRQSGQIAPTAAFDNTGRSLSAGALPATSGCLRNGSNSGYYAFTKL
jgi:hypothetical protein